MLSRRVSTCLDRITRVVFSSGLGRRAIVKVYKLTTRLIIVVETWERCVPRATLLIRSLHLLRYYLLSLLLLSTYGGNKSNNFSRDFTRGAARYGVRKIHPGYFIRKHMYSSLDHFFFFFRLYRRCALLQFDVTFIARGENSVAETTLTHGIPRGNSA